MNYLSIYNKLISRGQKLINDRENSRIHGEYFERHHIIPKCMGGSDNDINLVMLTPEEHFLVHLLLIKIYPSVYDLYLSVQIMIGSGKYKKNNKEYGKIKRLIQSNKKIMGMPLETRRKISESRKGIIFTDEQRRKISDSRKGKSWEDIMGEETAKKVRLERSQPRTPLSADTKEKISKSKQGIPPHLWTDEMKLKVSRTMTGRKKSETQRAKLKEYNSLEKICPFCGKNGSGPAMQRWHFNNCTKKC